MLFVRAYPRETQEMVFDAHNRAFAFFKGTCTRLSEDQRCRHENVPPPSKPATSCRFPCRPLWLRGLHGSPICPITTPMTRAPRQGADGRAVRPRTRGDDMTAIRLEYWWREQVLRDSNPLFPQLRRALPNTTRRRSKRDSNLYGAFPVKFVFGGKASSSVAWDQVPGARGRGQGTETLAQLGGVPP